MIWIQKKPRGGWFVWLVSEDVPALLELPGRLRGLLADPDFADRAIQRLFPSAYEDDPEAEAEYRRLLGDDLRRRKLEGVEAFEKTLLQRREFQVPVISSVSRVELAEEEITLWLGFLHDMRLVLGIRLDITDESWEKEPDPSHPQAAEMLLLHRLAYLEEAIVQALREAEKLE